MSTFARLLLLGIVILIFYAINKPSTDLWKANEAAREAESERIRQEGIEALRQGVEKSRRRTEFEQNRIDTMGFRYPPGQQPPGTIPPGTVPK
jgi:hypothetical protein